MSHKQIKAFSLIELLVVIAVMAMVMAIGLPNYLSARQRARDAKIKQEMVQFKNALRMYYNDYQRYPTGTGMRPGSGLPGGPTAGMGCGLGANAVCGTDATDGCQFVAGADDCTGTVYMKRFPNWNKNTIGFSTLRYYASGDGQSFILRYKLENQGDSEIAASQSRCAASLVATGQALVATDFYVCED